MSTENATTVVCNDASSLSYFVVVLVPCKQNFPEYLEFKQKREALRNPLIHIFCETLYCKFITGVKRTCYVNRHPLHVCHLLDVATKTVSTGWLGHSQTVVQCIFFLEGAL